jgi:hypothetical protein
MIGTAVVHVITVCYDDIEQFIYTVYKDQQLTYSHQHMLTCNQQVWLKTGARVFTPTLSLMQ